MKTAFTVAILTAAGAAAWFCLAPDSWRNRNPAASTPRPFLTAQIICNTKSRVAHRGDCRYALQISPESREIADSIAAAQDDGYRPCAVCKPWTRPAATQPVTKTKEKP